MSEELSFKSVGIKKTDPSLYKTLQAKPVGIKTPLELGTGRSGLFNMTFDPADQIVDNFRNLLLTNFGDRMGRYDYGTNIRAVVFDMTAKDDWDSEVMLLIKTAVTKFMPYIDLESFSSDLIEKQPDTKDQYLSHIRIKLKFNIPKLGVIGRSLALNIWVAG